MRRITTDGPTGQECAKWLKKARKSCDLMLKEYVATSKAPKTKAAVWSELKQLFLIVTFNGRCAYCEAKLPTGNFSAHVEHYRPKATVTDKGKKLNHTGYFWLAYEWYNLLLVCEKCNTWHSEVIDGKQQSNSGKSTEFRIQGSRVTAPGDDVTKWRQELEEEKPLLLNPYDDDPTKHIGFAEGGVPYPVNKCPRGAETIRVCHLDRIELCAQRLKYADEQSKLRLFQAVENKGPVNTDDLEYTLWMEFALNAAIARLFPRPRPS